VTDLVIVEINCPDEGVAAAIAAHVVEARLAACANIHAPVDSLYHWKGRADRAREVPPVLKTRAALLPALVAAARELHPYETPSILAHPVEANDDYRAWVLAETGGA
jgi:periplasmic divalent cation tolerance protein